MLNGKDGNSETRTPPCCSPRSPAEWYADEHACAANQHADARPRYALNSCECENSNDNDIPVKVLEISIETDYIHGPKILTLKVTHLMRQWTQVNLMNVRFRRL